MPVKEHELIAPAGNWSCLVSAVSGGADAVYFSVKGLNMRKGADNFDLLELPKVMDFLKKKEKKGYLALNTLVYDGETDKVRKILSHARSCGVDAVIAWDMSVVEMAGEAGMTVHLSTQAGVANYRSFRAYASMGIKRVVLARECGLPDIRNIASRAKEDGLDCEVETFIHGAMCVSVSGRCFLSHHSFGKSANRGECLQPCRREFILTEVEDGTEGGCEYVLRRDSILSPRDLCTMGFFDEMMGAGIKAFKIEGRMRSPEYVGVATAAYREAMDAYYRGKLDDARRSFLISRLKKVFNRGFEPGFYKGSPAPTGGRVEKGYIKTYAGKVVKFYKKIGVAEIAVYSGELARGTDILITGNKTPASFATIEEMQIEHEPVETVSKGRSVGVKLPFAARPGDKVFTWEKA